MKLKQLAALCALSIAGNAYADVTVKETDKFQDVAEKVSQLTAKGESPLIVIDIDNTLLTSTSDIGGDIWYQWQRGKLDVKPSAEDKVGCLFEDSIGLLYELVPMKIIEDNATGNGKRLAGQRADCDGTDITLSKLPLRDRA